MNLNVPRLDSGTPLTEQDLTEPAPWRGKHLQLVQPMAAEAATDVSEEPASSEYDFPWTERDRRIAAWFWKVILAIALVGMAALIAYFMPV